MKFAASLARRKLVALGPFPFDEPTPSVSTAALSIGGQPWAIDAKLVIKGIAEAFPKIGGTASPIRCPADSAGLSLGCPNEARDGWEAK